MGPDSVLILLLGWVLGMLSVVITDALREWRDTRAVRKSIRTELEELRYKSALVVFQVAVHQGSLTRKLAGWLHDAIQSYEGVYLQEGLQVELHPLLEANESEFQAALARLRAPAGIALGLKKYSLSFSGADVRGLSGRSKNLARYIQDIRAQIEFLNQSVDDARFYLRFTFDSSLSPSDHQRVSLNLDAAAQAVERHVRNIVERAGKALKWL